jgi:phenylacetyl-CoA:acceptor oxidoreductase subunit 2
VGSGLFLAATAFSPSLAGIEGALIAALLLLLAARAYLWRAYRNALAAEAPTRTLDVLADFDPWFLGVGFVAPVIALSLGLLVGNAAAFFALAGLAAFAAGWALKLILVTRAAYTQGFALTHTPVRGSGSPGPRVQPGWSFGVQGGDA